MTLNLILLIIKKTIIFLFELFTNNFTKKMEIETKILKVQKIFLDLYPYKYDFPKTLLLEPLNWKNDLFNSFVKQLKINRIIFDIITKSNSEIKLYFNNTNESYYEIIHNNKINSHIKKYEYTDELKSKFKTMSYDFIETFSWDYQFFNNTEDKYNDYERYVIILIYQNEYYGHIYFWKSENLCFCIGIRSRIDNIFIENKLKNISLHLLNGIENFCLENNCDEICVISPMGIMPKILKTLGFQSKMIEDTKLFEEKIYCESKKIKKNDR